MERLFIQTDEFVSQMKSFSKADELLIDIEQEVLKDIKKTGSEREIISGTGGFTKLRIALKSEGRGKSGSARLIYFDCKPREVVFLFMIYSKVKKDNISDKVKNLLKIKAKEFKQWAPKKKK